MRLIGFLMIMMAMALFIQSIAADEIKLEIQPVKVSQETKKEFCIFCGLTEELKRVMSWFGHQQEQKNVTRQTIPMPANLTVLTLDGQQQQMP